MAMKKFLAIFILIIVIAIGVFVWHRNQDTSASTGKDRQTQVDSQTATNDRKGFDKTERSIDSATSFWVVVNKHRPLRPSAYAPDDLRAPDVPLRLSASTDEMKMTRSAGDALKE